MALLVVKNLTKRFGGLIANRNISLQVDTGEIVAMTTEGKANDLPAHPADHATRGLTAFERLRAVALDCLACADARVPRAQRGQGRCVRKGWWRRSVRHQRL